MQLIFRSTGAATQCLTHLKIGKPISIGVYEKKNECSYATSLDNYCPLLLKS